MPAIAMEWPGLLLPSRPAVFHPENHSRTGGQSLTGSEQIVASPSGRWRARLDLPVYSEETALAYRSFVAQLEGRAGTVLVPKWEVFGPRDADGRPLSDRHTASTGMMFDLSDFGQSDQIYAELAAEAAQGSTRIRVDILDGEGPRPGHYFGIGDRLYLCQQVWLDGMSTTSVQFWPRLRAPALEGQRVILDRPVCLMRLAEDLSGELELDTLGYGSGSMQFVEAV